MFKNKWIQAIATVFLFAGCTETVSRDSTARIMTMGDSLLATHSISGRAVSNAVEAALGEQVIDRSVVGARVLYKLPISGSMGLKIAKQQTAGKWDWTILNGGGNDVWLGCGCLRCDRKIDKLISQDGRKGGIPAMVAKLRSTGSRVIYIGYLRSPGLASPIEHCKNEGDKLENRITTMAALDEGVFFLSLKELVPSGDRSYHAIDMIHPSVKASKAIGQMIADLIRNNEQPVTSLQ